MSRLAAKVKKAQSQDGHKDVIGGNCWKAQEILRDVTLPSEDIVRFIYLAEGPNLTTDIAIARDYVPLHVHTVHDELIYVLEGTGKFRVGRAHHIFGPGSIIYIPENTVHGGSIDEEIKILSVYTPKFDIRNPDRIFVDENGKPIRLD